MIFQQRLKELTCSHHENIEQAPLLKQIMSNEFALPDYIHLLKKFHDYISPCETIIFNSPWRSLLINREKTPLLYRDLLELGNKTETSPCALLPDLLSYEHVLGYLYVIEGSTLGGQIISKKLNNKFGIQPPKGTAYFNGYGHNTKAMWNLFCNTLNQINPDQEAAVISSACSTFTTLGNWIKTAF